MPQAKSISHPEVASFDDLVARLSEPELRLPKRLNQVAKFVLNNPEDTAIYSIVELSRMADVPISTFTRFSKELGFSGFSEFQSVFRQRLLGPKATDTDRRRALADAPLRDTTSGVDLDDPNAVFDAFIHGGIDTLLRLEEEIDRSVLGDFMSTLAEARTIHIVSARGAFGVGAYCFYGFSQVGKHANLIDNTGAMRAEQIRFMQPEDIALVITFDDYTTETLEIAEKIVAKGHRLLCITDNEMSPAARISSHALYVREGHLGHFRLQIPAMALCQSIILSVGRKVSRTSRKQQRPQSTDTS